MIRVYFVFEDTNDDDLVNLSYVDVATTNPGEAIRRVEEAAESGELWNNLYPDEEEHLYRLIKSKVRYLDISSLPHEHHPDTTLPAA